MPKYNKKRPLAAPSHPGEILKELWLKELKLSQVGFAQKLVLASHSHVKLSTMKTKLNELLSGKRNMNAEFALLISKVLKTDPKMWLKLQMQRDLWEAEAKIKALEVAA